MLDDHPVLKDRLHALAVFSGIAVAGVAGFDLVITGGFDFLTPGQEIRQVAPSQYVQVVEGPWQSEMRMTPLSSREPLFALGDTSQVEARLVGAMDDGNAPDAGYSNAPSEDELYRQIEALYARQDSYAVQSTSYEPEAVTEPYEYYVDEPRAAEPYEPAPYDEESDKVGGIKDGATDLSEVSAYESASPS